MTLTWQPPGRIRGTVALLHGVTSTRATWWRIGPALARLGWHTVAVDLPGHGQARPLGKQPRFEQLVEDVGRHLPARVDLLVGHSLGAIVALMLAGRAKALVLEDPPGEVGPDRRARLDQEIRAARQDPAWARRQLRQQNADWAEPDVTHAVDGLLSADLPGLLAVLAADVSWDLLALLAAAGRPALVLAPPQVGTQRDAVRGLVGPERFVEIEGRHCIHRSRPERWLDEVSGFAAAVLPERV